MKRMIALLLVSILLVLSTGCNMRGETVELDLYSAKRLSKTFDAIQSGELEIQYSNLETLPKAQAQILNHAGKLARIINVYLYNESTYDMHVHGYAWFISGENHCKGIYYNTEKKVANSTYEIQLDKGTNAYFLYELLVNEPITLDDMTEAFLFFKYEDTEYILGVNSEGTLLYWPKDQTL